MQIVLFLHTGPEQSSILPPRDRRSLNSWKTVLRRHGRERQASIDRTDPTQRRTREDVLVALKDLCDAVPERGVEGRRVGKGVLGLEERVVALARRVVRFPDWVDLELRVGAVGCAECADTEGKRQSARAQGAEQGGKTDRSAAQSP